MDSNRAPDTAVVSSPSDCCKDCPMMMRFSVPSAGLRYPFGPIRLGSRCQNTNSVTAAPKQYTGLPMSAEGERCLGITMSDEMSRPFTGASSLLRTRVSSRTRPCVIGSRMLAARRFTSRARAAQSCSNRPEASPAPTHSCLATEHQYWRQSAADAVESAGSSVSCALPTIPDGHPRERALQTCEGNARLASPIPPARSNDYTASVNPRDYLWAIEN
jgi:hypothetical protein